jgi:hypothetical protein
VAPVIGLAQSGLASFHQQCSCHRERCACWVSAAWRETLLVPGQSSPPGADRVAEPERVTRVRAVNEPDAAPSLRGRRSSSRSSQGKIAGRDGHVNISALILALSAVVR